MSSKNLKKKSAQQAGPIHIDHDLTIQHLGKIKAILDQALSTPQDLTLDLSSCQSLDTAGVQLLLAFAHAAKSQGRQTHWIWQDSSKISDKFQQLGLEEESGLVLSP